MKVEAIEFETLKGDTQHYIKITEGEEKVFIRCGQENYEKVKALLTGTNKEPKLFVNEEGNKQKPTMEKGGKVDNGK